MTVVVVACALTVGYIFGQHQPLRAARSRARTVAQRGTCSRADRLMFLLLHPLTGWRTLRSGGVR